MSCDRYLSVYYNTNIYGLFLNSVSTLSCHITPQKTQPTYITEAQANYHFYTCITQFQFDKNYFKVQFDDFLDCSNVCHRVYYIRYYGASICTTLWM